jgi:hypothetical protein
MARAPVSSPRLQRLGRLGKGFVLAISRRWPEPEAAYRSWARTGETFGLGMVQLVTADDQLSVASMVAQHCYVSPADPVAIRYDALARCLTASARPDRGSNGHPHATHRFGPEATALCRPGAEPPGRFLGTALLALAGARNGMFWRGGCCPRAHQPGAVKVRVCRLCRRQCPDPSDMGSRCLVGCSLAAGRRQGEGVKVLLTAWPGPVREPRRYRIGALGAGRASAA